MIHVCLKCNQQYEETMKKCPICGKRLKKQYTEEELEKIRKEEEDAMIVNMFFM